jgi:hypothetical protein
VITRLHNLALILVLVGLVILAAAKFIGFRGWSVWLGGGLFCVGLLLSCILIFAMRFSQDNEGESDFPEMLVLTFPADDGEYGTAAFRAGLQDLASRISKEVCDSSSAYDGDEFGCGSATLYFAAKKATDLWRRIEELLPAGSEFRPSQAISVSSAGRKTSLFPRDKNDRP